MHIAAQTPAAPRLRVVLSGIAILAVAVPTIVVRNAPTITPRPRAVLPPQRIVPKAEVPPVEPVEFVDLAPEDARAFNAHVPFSTGPNPAARPFRFAGPASDLARATDCMATAVLYEAGDDAAGQRAVAQVVLNRLRHPAFPKSVCGVIFEGQERRTGCQFSFSCDGAVRRWHPSDDAWARARAVAGAALTGSVYRPVGYATHYHTDWVVPYWQSSLDKIAAVHSHLFFRWSGWWGTPPAFRREPAGAEPAIAQLADLSDAHRTGAALAEANAALAEASAALGFVTGDDMSGASAAGMPAPLPADRDTILVALPAGASPETYPAAAALACGDRPFCRYMAWPDRTRVPTGLPLTPAQSATMAFSYLRDRASGYEKPLWNCQQTARVDAAQCMRVQMTMRAQPVRAAAASPSPSPPPAAAVPELGGVRRQADIPPRTAARPGAQPGDAQQAARPAD